MFDVLFAGLHFRLHGEQTQLRGFHTARRALSPLPADAQPLAEVVCELQTAPSVTAERWAGHPIEWSWQGASGQVRTRHFQANIEQLGPRQFAVQTHLAADPHAATTLLSAVAPPLLHALGGAVLHAASVELEGRAVVFVGPSGAGKSTACQHVAGALWYSLDRLAVAPAPDTGSGAAGYLACPLPGGKGWQGDAPGSSCATLPLAAILRVVQSSPGPRLAPCAAHRCLSLLRQAAVHGDRSAASEQALLSALEALSRTVAVGTLEFALEDELRPGIERFLTAFSQKRVRIMKGSAS
ncbi:MAG: hypothetical protein RL033_6417 [Pseudomonadota bacterium]